MTNDSRILCASKLIGVHVHNGQGEGLGKIEDIMLDVDNGKIIYCVLSFGGFLGIHNKLFAVPLGNLKLSPDGKEFILNLDREILEKAPGFDKDNWPDFTSGGVREQIYNYYGAEPYNLDVQH